MEKEFLTVKLTPDEMLHAALSGVLRQIENIGRGRKPYYGAGNTNDWQLHIEGALGEAAFAKWVNKFWLGRGSFRGPDVDKFDVRTRSRHEFDLIIHPDDKDEKKFFLVTGNNGKYRIHGYMKAEDGKKDEFWKDPSGGRPAYFIPKDKLRKPWKKKKDHKK